MTEIDINDVDAINQAATQEFGDWGPEVLVTQDMVDQFADLTGDRQWIHVDVERCERESPFGGPIAHGFLTLALMPQVMPPATFTPTGVKNAVNYGSDGFRFLAPVPVGSSLHARTRLCGAESHRAGTLVTTETAIHVVGNDKPSLRYTGKILYQG
ncbi:MAG: MaoC family dehydratase [Xanthomonadales bacterium]|nr:MaoC family dehydratase [Xanthomonadales bacterium]